MNIKGLLLEATPVPYLTVKSNKHSKSEDTWTFVVRGITYGVKANSIRPTGCATYKKSKLPSLFHLFTISDSGTVNKKIKSIQSPLTVIATMAEIIANETHDNKLNVLTVIRMPSIIGTETAAKIIDRYVKKSGVPFEYVGLYSTANSGEYKYLTLKRKSSNIDISTAFGLSADAVSKIDLVSDSQVTQDEIIDKIEGNIKRFIPKKIDVTKVVGAEDTPPEVHEFNKKNKPIVNRMVTDKLEFDKINLNQEVMNVNELIYNLNDLTEFTAADYNITDFLNGLVSYPISNVDKERVKIATDKIMEIKPTVYDLTTSTNKSKQIVDILQPFGLTDQKIDDFFNITIDAILYKQSNYIVDYYKNAPKTVKRKDLNAVAGYCSTDYTAMNRFLIRGTGTDKVKDMCRDMDDAFISSGLNIEDSIKLYRGMSLSDATAAEIATGKLFHFRTYVSTSMNPRVGFTFGASTIGGLASLAIDPNKSELEDTDGISNPLSCSMIISGAHVLPVIIPTQVTQFPRECEVILPRGITLRLDNCIATKNKKGMVFYTMMEMSVIPPDELIVNEMVYDGDEFNRTGNLIEFIEKTESLQEEIANKKQKQKSNSRLSLLGRAALGRLSKFAKMTAKEKAEYTRNQDKFNGDLM